jgi:hypothetical protein
MTTNTTEVLQAAKKPDGTLTTQVDNQIFIMNVFFDHNSTETFQDKLLRVVLAEEMVTN